jgi:hypothetical protein
MDNGLIFPYPLTRANAEASDANRGWIFWWAFGSAGGEVRDPDW